MIEQLFGSKTRVKLLQLFYSNPNRAFYVREITRRIDEQINSVRRELSNLLSIGIISSENTNNKLYYEVNQKYEYFAPLAEIFGDKTGLSAKSTGGDSDLKALGHVDLALLTGQFTRDDRSGVDLLIVGDVNQTQVSKYVEELEEKEKKAVRYTIMSPKEFGYRQKMKDRFMTNIIEAKKQILVDRKAIFSTDYKGQVEEETKDKKEK